MDGDLFRFHRAVQGIPPRRVRKHVTCEPVSIVAHVPRGTFQSLELSEPLTWSVLYHFYWINKVIQSECFSTGCGMPDYQTQGVSSTGPSGHEFGNDLGHFYFESGQGGKGPINDRDFSPFGRRERPLSLLILRISYSDL